MTYFPRHVTSSAHDADLKGNNFRGTIHPQSFIAVAFIFSKLDRGPDYRKKPCLDRKTDRQRFNEDLKKVLSKFLARSFLRTLKIHKNLPFKILIKYSQGFSRIRQRFNEDPRKVFSNILARSFLRNLEDPQGYNKDLYHSFHSRS